MKTVFVLKHLNIHSDGNEDVRMIGVYATREDAEAAAKRLASQPGFRDHPAIVDYNRNVDSRGFHLGEYNIDQDHWQEGYSGIRHPTAAAIARLSKCLGLVLEPGMQDWEIQCGDPDRAGEFVDFYLNGTRNDDERFSLMALILGSFEEYHGLSGPDPVLWQKISQILRGDIDLHRDQIEYYQCQEEEAGYFPISELMRQIVIPPRCREHEAT